MSKIVYAKCMVLGIRVLWHWEERTRKEAAKRKVHEPAHQRCSRVKPRSGIHRQIRGNANVLAPWAHSEAQIDTTRYVKWVVLFINNNGTHSNDTDPSDLREISMEELSQHGPESDEYWCCILGYVVRPNANNRIWFKTKKGRDYTSRALMHFHGINMDRNDDG